ncbi:hypothetical protein DSM106972_032100 [Dulcicalothrix desertica PCC 7102]|uniref:Uncharacterized protein n=1 Tax=Dulcicalothrix desertica PCC 7102 TaxID=232991 RepID=A0A3S5K3A5_9CYAN|nr:sigma factor [Dulcicalothrix desertica]RUT06004.1 hypothetical protein DSM106972_032100 [Dulcicalothrix desertica PCC 7102]TWH54330.1 sigma-70-like protein [Dulcicalothrix desertica PCC 7102]
MNEQQLQELALQAKQDSLLSAARGITLSKLIDGIYRSGKLCHPYRGQFQGAYEQIYQEAVQDLFLYICKNLDKYDPERGAFMTWVNMLLSQTQHTQVKCLLYKSTLTVLIKGRIA